MIRNFFNKCWKRIWYVGNKPSKFHIEYNRIQIYFQSSNFYDAVYKAYKIGINLSKYLVMSIFVLGTLMLFGYSFNFTNFFSSFSILVLVNEVPKFLKRCRGR